MKHSDVYTGAILLALSAGIYALTTGFDEVPAMLSQNVPPTFFPRLVITIVVLLSAALVIRGFSKAPVTAHPVQPVVFITTGIIIAAGFLVGWLGTLPTLCLTAVAIPVAWGERRRLHIVALAIGLPAAIYLIFSLVLGIRFPAGQLLSWPA